MTAPQELRSKAAAMMPELLADLERLVAIPSVAFPGYPPEPVTQMADETLRLFREAGFANAELQEVPTGYPPVYGEIPGPDGAPAPWLAVTGTNGKTTTVTMLEAILLAAGRRAVAAGNVGRPLVEVVTARADDGTPEVVEDADRRFAVGVLWHPEAGDDLRLFQALVDAAG